MRLHTLTVTAFGPFAGTETLDFEELNDAGVFLITGPTGAGKTSLLDAVCFALFGQVPGSREVRSLKSHHAAAETRPEVCLDVTLAGRRFVVRRSPAWTRPKKRGEGLTEENASASLLEIVDGQEVLRSSRADEVGLELSRLLGGMNAAQFQQVALLPQGEFQTFLQAASEDRRKVLQQLFRTDRFARIEEWFADHTRALKQATAADEAAVRRLVDTLADRAGAAPGQEFAGEQLGAAAADGSVLAWARGLSSAAQEESEVASGAAERAAAADAAAALALATGERTAERLLRVRDAEATLAALAEDTALQDAAALLDDDTRAATCAPLIRLLDDATDRLRRRRDSRDALAAEVGSSEDLAARRARLVARRDALREVAPREAELALLVVEAATLHDRLAEVADEVSRHATHLERLPDERASLVERLDRLRETAALRPAAAASVDACDRRRRACIELVAVEADVTRLRAEALAHAEAFNDARERALDLTARRLEGIAAELAGALLDDAPCQVCGSPTHPAPASAAVDAVDPDAHRAAQAEAEALRPVQEAARQRLDDVTVRAAGLASLTQGLSVDEATKEHASAREALAVADDAVTEVGTLTRALADLDALIVSSRTALADAEERRGALTTAAALADRSAAELRAHVAELVGDLALTDAVATTDRELDAVDALARAEEELGAARDEHQRLVEAAVASASGVGFSSVDAARSAELFGATRAALSAQVEACRAALVAAQAVLDDPDHADLPEALPDLTRLREAAGTAAAELRARSRDLDLARDRSRAIATQVVELAGAVERWQPAYARLAMAQSLTRLVKGSGADNQLQMRLSSYVLATRLDQVVEAANARLREMRDQRYHLARTPDATRRGSQAGLDLRMVDAWTGEERSPASLSGGECFVVSLALALGLSDVVTYESGGIELGTLFVDEGFGMLDLDTLDDVMDRIDDLRAGGRTVGVVSHVTELRARIPTQVDVTKHQSGSTVRVRTLTA